jgi:hypothetical protein
VVDDAIGRKFQAEIVAKLMHEKYLKRAKRGLQSEMLVRYLSHLELESGV